MTKDNPYSLPQENFSEHMKCTQFLQHQEVQMRLLIQCSHSEPSVEKNSGKKGKKALIKKSRKIDW